MMYASGCPALIRWGMLRPGAIIGSVARVSRSAYRVYWARSMDESGCEAAIDLGHDYQNRRRRTATQHGYPPIFREQGSSVLVCARRRFSGGHRRFDPESAARLIIALDFWRNVCISANN